MTSMTTVAIVAFGVVGGIIPDLLRILKYRNKKAIPGFLKYPMFWIGLAVMLFLGAFTAWLLDANTPLQAVACGFSAPEILSRALAAQNDRINDRGDQSFDLRGWWRG